MQYFTLLGKGNYSRLLTYFQDLGDSKVEEIRFVQEAVYKRYASEIDEMIVFATEAAQNMHLEQLKIEVGCPDLQVVTIDEEISAEEFIDVLVEKIHPDSKIIFDITHGYRVLPMKLLFGLKYVEQSKNIEIEHLYYGKVLNFDSPDERVCEIIDFMDDYRTQELTEYLGQFDRTLIISSRDWEGLKETDPKIQAFLDALDTFNEMVEFCEMDRALQAVREIKERARSLEKEPQKYQILLPLTAKISNKFNFSSTNAALQMAELIRILMAHKRYQVAVTFTDQMLRNELIYCLVGSRSMDMCKKRLRFGPHEAKGFSFDVSQYIQHGLINQNNRAPVDSRLTSYNWDRKKTADVARILRQNEKTLKDFRSNTRNSMNHAKSMDQNIKNNLENNLEKMLEDIILPISRVTA